ncbi:hypothetical protein Q1695_013223 [Nippostrongylus brasiliensis]|nr:hypothetical protein Q1695_013223 [Nippostrongylus brasiliensis]
MTSPQEGGQKPTTDSTGPTKACNCDECKRQERRVEITPAKTKAETSDKKSTDESSKKYISPTTGKRSRRSMKAKSPKKGENRIDRYDFRTVKLPSLHLNQNIPDRSTSSKKRGKSPATAKETSRRAPPPAAPEKSYSYTMPEVAEGDMKTARGTPVASTPRGRRSSSVRSRQGDASQPQQEAQQQQPSWLQRGPSQQPQSRPDYDSTRDYNPVCDCRDCTRVREKRKEQGLCDCYDCIIAKQDTPASREHREKVKQSQSHRTQRPKDRSKTEFPPSHQSRSSQRDRSGRSRGTMSDGTGTGTGTSTPSIEKRSRRKHHSRHRPSPKRRQASQKKEPTSTKSGTGTGGGGGKPKSKAKSAKSKPKTTTDSVSRSDEEKPPKGKSKSKKTLKSGKTAKGDKKTAKGKKEKKEKNDKSGKKGKGISCKPCKPKK